MNDSEDNVQKDPVFYYSRERRLSRASPRVQQMNDGVPIRPSLSKTLFATRGHKLIFATIILFCITFGFTSRFSGRGEVGLKLGGNSIAMIIVPVEETLVMEIAKKVPKSGEFYIGAVDIAVSPVMPKPREGEQGEAPRVFSHRIIFNAVESENYNLSLPFDGTDYFVVFSTGDEHKSIRLKVRDGGNKRK